MYAAANAVVGVPKLGIDNENAAGCSKNRLFTGLVEPNMEAARIEPAEDLNRRGEAGASFCPGLATSSSSLYR
jgi:hypothetical protein